MLCNIVVFYFFLFFFFFFNDTATTEIYTRSIVGSVRCVQETAFILITGMGGCMNKEEKDNKKVKEQEANGPEEIKDQIIAFLEKKYGKEFVPLSLEIDRWPYHWDDLSAYPKGGDKEKDSFCAYRQEKDGKYVFSDTYFGLIVHDEYEQKVKEIANKYFSKYQVDVSFEGDIFSNELNCNSKLQDAIDCGEKIDPTIKIKVAPTFNSIGDFDKQVDLFIQEMIEKKLQSSILVFYLWNEDFDTNYIDNTSFQKIREINIFSDFTFKEYQFRGEDTMSKLQEGQLTQEKLEDGQLTQEQLALLNNSGTIQKIIDQYACLFCAILRQQNLLIAPL
eukprot:TRINITY_DN2586_c0_g1_i8.p1 TRINITY_DN2586_c0_g1~~TRINITY_DN2586_c0_g1_i8.p1  ORF type:complete len:334 (+),score=73.44 TRINITY_DN2586_c0_g1_i8:91-1092(+)